MRSHAPCAGLRNSGGRNPDSGFCRCAGRLVEGVFTVNVSIEVILGSLIYRHTFIEYVILCF